jgi:hypothetical protein
MDTNLIFLLTAAGLSSVLVILAAAHIREERKFLNLIEQDYHRGKKRHAIV